MRGLLTTYDDLIDVDTVAATGMPQLRAGIAVAHQTYQAARYEQLTALLPAIPPTADHSYRAGDRDDQELALGYVSAYVVAAKLLTKVGATDLALLAADRAANRAIDSQSLPLRGLAAYRVACALLRADRSDDAEHLAVSMAERVQAQARSDAPMLVSVAGRCAEALDRQRREQQTTGVWAADLYVFSSSRRTPLDAANVRRSFRAVCD